MVMWIRCTANPVGASLFLAVYNQDSMFKLLLLNKRDNFFFCWWWWSCGYAVQWTLWVLACFWQYMIKIQWSLLYWHAIGWMFFSLSICFATSSMIMFHLLQACVKRVEGDDTSQKHCTGQYFDYWFCIDKCVSFSFHFVMLSWIIIGLVHMQNSTFWNMQVAPKLLSKLKWYGMLSGHHFHFLSVCFALLP
jgi:hypothetical protein